MKIYTKKGDAGETGLIGGVRVSKDDFRIRTYGALDEVNSFLGALMALDESSPKEFASVLRERIYRVQGELFQVGAELATPRGKSIGIALVEHSQVEQLEREIDQMEAELPGLTTFILPGGSPLAAWLHLARTSVRRAERELVVLHRAEPQRAEVLQYVNRLSDYFFVCARWANFKLGAKDIPWIAPTLN